MAKSTRRRRSKRSPIQTILGTIGAILLAAFLFVMQTLFPGLFPSPGGSNPGGNPGATQPPVVETNANWLTVYFTTPNPPDAATSAVETEVINAINGATTSIDAASFDFNLPKMTQALVAAKQRGVRVRVVMDEEEGRYVVSDSAPAGIEGYDALAALRRANVEIVNGGRSNGIMHNKILIIDNRVMYIGSWNFSYNDTFRNDNNILKITAQRIIENYRGKFDEMFSLRQFGTRARVGARNPNMTINGINVENYFSPVDEVMQQLVSEVSGARSSIKILAFTYTHPDLAAAMLTRQRAGVRVEGVFENRGASQGQYNTLFCAGAAVRKDSNKYTMHHKVIIIDDTTVITGSFNFTKSADEINDDNVIIIHDASVARAFLQEYARVYGAATTPARSEIPC
jgi:phosphatidylserine/phosphatidylglycerophosphate/cardiolipin synthase-like enzyme